MNEMDLMTKIEGLEKAIKEHQDFVNTYNTTLTTTKQQLVDYNKPELEPAVFDQITDAVESVLSDFDFTDVDNYQDLEYELDYDGRVSLSNISFDPYDLQEKVCNAVYKLFKEADCPTDEESARDDREAEQVADQLNTQTKAEVVFDRDTDEKPSEEDMNEFNNKVEETKDKSFKKRTWFK